MNTLPDLSDDLKPPKARLPKNKDVGITDQQVDANAQEMGQRWGASTSLPAPAPPPGPAPAEVRGVRCYVPAYLDDELAVRAAGRRVTRSFLIVEALQKAGYRVDPVDLVEDRRKKG